ncbi:MAG: hypothetical protein V3W00_03240, partial [Candidatus Brocadiales bacterium]
AEELRNKHRQEREGIHKDQRDKRKAERERLRKELKQDLDDLQKLAREELGDRSTELKEKFNALIASLIKQLEKLQGPPDR